VPRPRLHRAALRGTEERQILQSRKAHAEEVTLAGAPARSPSGVADVAETPASRSAARSTSQTPARPRRRPGLRSPARTRLTPGSKAAAVQLGQPAAATAAAEPAFLITPRREPSAPASPKAPSGEEESDHLAGTAGRSRCPSFHFTGMAGP
jgi:hypothetical protein